MRFGYNKGLGITVCLYHHLNNDLQIRLYKIGKQGSKPLVELSFITLLQILPCLEKINVKKIGKLLSR